MVERLNDARILIYSHDSFGLGHLRRCRAIAHAARRSLQGVVDPDPVGLADHRQLRFPRPRRLRSHPGVIKLHDGEYQSLGLHIDVEQTMEMRASIIRQTALSFRPDLFLVDKEPLGSRRGAGDARDAQGDGTTLVLGLRDIMDEPSLLFKEWERKQVLPRCEHLYDEIWVYGLERFANPLAGVRVRQACGARSSTRILRRALPNLTKRRRSLGGDPYPAGDGGRRR
jgi:predicted glycosyltransferase